MAIPKPANHIALKSSEFKTFSMGVSAGAADLVASYLRDGIYSDSRMACVREYAFNARDEHDKHGITRPVELTLSKTEFRVRDFAKGLEQEDMKTLFGELGNSDKRENDNQTGCFGIGSSAAFSYTDSFSAVSICDGIKTVYAFMLEVGKGGISRATASVISEDFAEEDEPSGIEIIIPLKEEDYFQFDNKVIEFMKWDLYNDWFKYTYEPDPYRHLEKDPDPNYNEELEGEPEDLSPDVSYNLNIIDSFNTDCGRRVHIFKDSQFPNNTYVKVGHAIYRYNLWNCQDMVINGCKVLVEIDNKDVSIALNREEIKKDKEGETEHFLNVLDQSILKKMKDIAAEIIKNPTPLDILHAHAHVPPKGNGWCSTKTLRQMIVDGHPIPKFRQEHYHLYQSYEVEESGNTRLKPLGKCRTGEYNRINQIVIVGDKPFGMTKVNQLHEREGYDPEETLYARKNYEVTDFDECIQPVVVDLKDYEYPKPSRKTKIVQNELGERIKIKYPKRLRSMKTTGHHFLYNLRNTTRDTKDWEADIADGALVCWATKDELEKYEVQPYHNRVLIPQGIFIPTTIKATKFAEAKLPSLKKYLECIFPNYKKVEENDCFSNLDQLGSGLSGEITKLYPQPSYSLERVFGQVFFKDAKFKRKLDKKIKKVVGIRDGNTLMGAAFKLYDNDRWAVHEDIKTQIENTIKSL